MPWPKAGAITKRLEYLQRQEMLAVLNSDRSTMVLCRLAWADVYRTEVLDLASGVAGVSRMLPATLKAVLDTVPAWRRFQRARPLRLVVKRELYDVKFGYNRKAVYYKESLICGHVLHLPEDLFGEPAPKRRRCAQCAEIALGAKPNDTSTNASQRN